MTVLYRVLGIFLNIAAIILTLCIVFSIPVLFSSPLNMLSGFMLASIVLYVWFSNKFHRQVLLQQQAVKPGLRDWIRVNGIVSLIYSMLIIVGMVTFISDPQILVDQMKLMGVSVPVNSLRAMLSILLVFGIVLFVHIIWTFALIKKNIEFFKS